MTAGISSIDFWIIIAYVACTLAVGIWFARGQKSLDEYFLAGRSAQWWIVGVSIIASDFSAISYIGAPAWVFEKDLGYSVGTLVLPFVMLAVVYLFVPFMARLRLFTIYEYLEHRFGAGVRMFASGLFQLLRGGWLATAIYAQSLVLSQITGLSFITCACLVGGLTAVYTVLGGMKAVLWTDFLQFIILNGGIVIMFAVVVHGFDGNLAQIWRLAAQGGHTRMLSLHFDLTTEVTLWALIAGQFVINLSSYGSDQVIVQRYFTAGSKRELIRAIFFSGVMTVPVMMSLFFLGLVLSAYYRVHPDLAATLSNAQQVIPHFVTNALPPGLAGLVIAGIFAATMSSLSATFNSLSTATVMDFYARFLSRPLNAGPGAVWVGRCCTLGWAMVGILASLFVARLGSIIQIMGKINGFFSGPLIGMFLLGVLTKRANSTGVLSGAVLGAALTGVVSHTSTSWLWYGPIGCLTTLVTGYAISCLHPAPAQERVVPLTVWRKAEE